MRYFLSIFIVIMAVSCEYEPEGNNFKELAPPENNIQVEITLNDIDPKDTIYIYQDTRIKINIRADNELKQLNIQMDNNNFYPNNFYDFTIGKHQFSEGKHKLTVNALFSSGSGSLADLMGLEGYAGEISWNLRVINNIDNYYKIGYRTNKEGFLEVFWNNSIMPDTEIEKYVVHFGSTNKDTVITDSSVKSIVDFDYVCGDGYYWVQTYLKNTGFANYSVVSFTKPNPKLYFEDLGLNEFRVYWDKPFAKGKFELQDNEKTLYEVTDTSIILQQKFGKYWQFTLNTRPREAKYGNLYYPYRAYGDFYQGHSLKLGNWPLYSYSITDQLLYTTSYEYLVAIDATTLQEKNRKQIKGNPWGIAYGGETACAPHNSTILAMTGEETWIFEDSRLVNQTIIQGLRGGHNVILYNITSDDRFYTVNYQSKTCKVHDVLTGNKLFDFTFTYTPVYNAYTCVAVSEDGRYFCSSSENGIEIFEINGTTINMLYTDTRRYLASIFVPSQPDKIIVKVGNDVEIRQMPGFDLLLKHDLTNSILYNIDPVSGYLLYYQNEMLKIATLEDLIHPLLEVRVDEAKISYTSFRMYHYNLLDDASKVLPIKSYLNLKQ